MKLVSTTMIVCWSLLCLGLLWPWYIYVRLVYFLDALTVGRMAVTVAYFGAVAGLGISVGRGVYLKQQWAISASLISAVIALIIAHPFLIRYHPLVHFSPDTTQFDGPGAIFGLVAYGFPIAISALPYLVVRSITLTDNEHRKVSALKTTKTHRGSYSTTAVSTEDDRE